MLQMTYDWLNLTHEFLLTLYVHPFSPPFPFTFLSGLLLIGKAIFPFPLLKVGDGAKITFPYCPVCTTAFC